MRFLLPLTLVLACSRTTENTRIDEDPVNSVDGSEPAVEPSAELFDLDGDGYLEDEDCDAEGCDDSANHYSDGLPL